MKYGNFYNGISKSRFDQSGFDSLINVDIHTETGSVRNQLSLVAETASNHPTEPCVSAICPNGDIYFFSVLTGKIWLRAQDGTFSLIHTNANGAHYGAHYFNGAVYYATWDKLGRFDFATWTDTYGTIPYGGIKSMVELNLSLFIASHRYVGAVDNTGAYTYNALDLPEGYMVTTMTQDGDLLLIGTIRGKNVAYSYISDAVDCRVFEWDTYSKSWTTEDGIPERGVNTFVSLDNMIMAQCGVNGQLYYWTGSKMQTYRKVRGVTTSVGDQLSCMFNGKPLLAIGNTIYSLHRADKDLPIALVQEYTANGVISSLVASGTQLFVSHTNGLDKIGTTYATATIITPEAPAQTDKYGQVMPYSDVVVAYDKYPEGISIYTMTNNSGTWVQQTPIIDSIKKIVHFDGGLLDAQYCQAKVVLTPSGENYSVIRSIEVK